MTTQSLYDSLILFVCSVLVGNLTTFIYRLVCSFILFRNIRFRQHLINCSNAQVITPYKELIIGSILEELCFRAPLLITDNTLVYYFSVFGFGIAHFYWNKQGYNENLFAFGETIGTSFFAYALANFVLQHGIAGFACACILHVLMNFLVVCAQRSVEDQKKVFYNDQSGVNYRYLKVNYSLFCHLLRQIVSLENV